MGRRILLVDDEAPILFAMYDYFTGRGYEVDRARAGPEAEALLAARSYAVVIADLRLAMMDGTSGLEILAGVSQRRPSTRTILLTAYGSPAIEREARRRGVDVFLYKPQPLPEVARIVEALLASGRAGGPAGPGEGG